MIGPVASCREPIPACAPPAGPRPPAPVQGAGGAYLVVKKVAGEAACADQGRKRASGPPPERRLA